MRLRLRDMKAVPRSWELRPQPPAAARPFSKIYGKARKAKALGTQLLQAWLQAPQLGSLDLLSCCPTTDFLSQVRLPSRSVQHARA